MKLSAQLQSTFSHKFPLPRHHQSCFRPEMFFVEKVKLKCQIPDQTQNFVLLILPKKILYKFQLGIYFHYTRCKTHLSLLRPATRTPLS